MYDLNKIKEYMKLAQEAVKDEVEPYRSEAFKILFSKLLNSTQTPEETFVHLESDPKYHLSLDQKMNEFAKKCNLTVRELRDVFSMNDDLISIIAPIEGTEAEKQSIASQCILTAYELLFDMEWLESSKLMKCINSSGIGGLDHFARNIRKKKIFRIQGKGKGKALEYKISGLGRLQAFEIIHDLAKGESFD